MEPPELKFRVRGPDSRALDFCLWGTDVTIAGVSGFAGAETPQKHRDEVIEMLFAGLTAPHKAKIIPGAKYTVTVSYLKKELTGAKLQAHSPLVQLNTLLRFTDPRKAPAVKPEEQAGTAEGLRYSEDAEQLQHSLQSTQLLIWDPSVEIGGLPLCVNCKRPTTSGGWSSGGPRTMIGLNADLFVLAKQYACSGK